jgi:hypothetical protein
MKYNYFLVLTIIVCIYASYANVQKFRADASTNDLRAPSTSKSTKSKIDNSGMTDGENNVVFRQKFPRDGENSG